MASNRGGGRAEWEDFPHEVDVTFNPRAEQAIVRIELPPHDVVPTVGVYKYLSTKDEERTTARPKSEVQSLYRQVISQVALLEGFDAVAMVNG